MSLATWFKDVFAPEGVIYDGGADSHFTVDLTPKRPRLAIVNHAPSRDEFQMWRDDPTTQFIFAALRQAQADQKAAWDEIAWEGGNADPLALCEFRTRADAYAGLEEADYSAFCEWAGLQPENIDA